MKAGGHAGSPARASSFSPTIAAAVARLPATLHATPLGRGCHWLREVRDRATIAPCISHVPFDAQAEGCSGASSAPLLFPMHLPARPRSLFGSSPSRVTSSRRSLMRAALRRTAWLLTEWQIATFSFLSAGCPKSPARWGRHLGPWQVSVFQEQAFEHMLLDNLSFCRLRPSVQEGPSRGIARFLGLLQDFERRWESPNVRADAAFFEAANSVALPVVVDRLSLPSPAGTIDPAEILPEPYRTAFLDMDARTDPEWHQYGLPRSCYRVAASEESMLRERMLSAGMAQLIEVSDIPVNRWENPLLAGLFGVAHKKASDRLIFDRRPQNSGERRLGWAKLPLGSQLSRLVLPPEFGVRCSGDDLRSWFYQLLNAPDSLARNVFGRVFDGSEVDPRHGGRPGVAYRMALRVIAMGDLNAVDIAQQTHLEMLMAFACMKPAETLIYGQPLPNGLVFEGLYIDDHFTLCVCRQADRDRRSGRDVDIIDQSHAAYRHYRVPRAEEKAFGWSDPATVKMPDKSIIIGTEVSSTAGTAGSPLLKRVHLFSLTLAGLSLKRTSKPLVVRNTALFIHPFMHRRELMCVFHRIYKWTADLPEKEPKAWAADIKDELAMAAFLLPQAVAHLRWPVSSRLTATDATPDSGGAVVTHVAEDLANALFRTCENRGCYVRLDTNSLVQEYPLLPPDPLVGSMLQCMEWKVHRSYRMSRRAHINLQEMREVCREVKEMASSSLSPVRSVNILDSQVTLGAWAKGRSSSFALNGLLRGVLGFKVAGRKCLDNLHVRSADNPADDPSRFAQLRVRAEPEAWMVPLFCPSARSWSVARRSAPATRACLEIFAGRAGLSSALQRQGLQVLTPMEAYPVVGKKVQYVSLRDIMNPEVLTNVRCSIRDGEVVYTHFGLPCKTWAAAGRLNHGTRRKGQELGDGSLAREREANVQLQTVVLLAVELILAGGHFTLENPHDSYVFQTEILEELGSLCSVYRVSFDQCAYGLKLPGADPYVFCRKRTSVLGTLPEVSLLERWCPGFATRHTHDRAWGTRVVGGKRVSLASEAGRYPERLCSAWAAAVQAGLGRGPSVLSRSGLVQLRRRLSLALMLP